MDATGTQFEQPFRITTNRPLGPSPPPNVPKRVPEPTQRPFRRDARAERAESRDRGHCRHPAPPVCRLRSRNQTSRRHARGRYASRAPSASAPAPGLGPNKPDTPTGGRRRRSGSSYRRRVKPRSPQCGVAGARRVAVPDSFDRPARSPSTRQPARWPMHIHPALMPRSHHSPARDRRVIGYPARSRHVRGARVRRAPRRRVRHRAAAPAPDR
jgi:hypothetical protein